MICVPRELPLEMRVCRLSEVPVTTFCCICNKRLSLEFSATLGFTLNAPLPTHSSRGDGENFWWLQPEAPGPGLPGVGFRNESGFNPEHTIIQTVGNVERAGFVHLDPVRLVELQCARKSTHTPRAALAAPGHANDPVLFQQVLSNDVVIGVGYNHIVIRIDT